MSDLTQDDVLKWCKERGFALVSFDVLNRPKGEWIIYVISMIDGEGCKCSECGFEGVPYWDYCPNCGADMRGEQDENR